VGTGRIAVENQDLASLGRCVTETPCCRKFPRACALRLFNNGFIMLRLEPIEE